MGSLACDRVGCNRIMCDRLILDHSKYICNECFNEMVEKRKKWSCCMSSDELRAKIEEFMNTPASTELLIGDDLDREFKSLTGHVRDYSKGGGFGEWVDET
jgi:hypothetical protein